MKGMVLAGALAAAALASTGSAEARADLQGFWGGGLKKGSGQIMLEAKIVSDQARFDVNMRYWGKDRENLRCQYYSKLDAGGAGPVYLNAGQSDGACPTKGAFTVQRISPSSVDVGTPPIGGISSFRLSETMRPLDAGEVARLPDSFRILDLAIGMTRAELEKALTAQGYASAKTSDVESRNGAWRATLVEYRPGGDPDVGDVVAVGYSASKSDAAPAGQKAMLIQRYVTPDQERPLQALDLRAAIKSRYGEPSTSQDRGTYMNFVYLADHSGKVLLGKDPNRDFCDKGTRSAVQLSFTPSGWRAGRDLKSHCGSKLDIYAEIDHRLGTIRSYSQGLSSADLATNDFWLKLGADLEEELKTFIETRENSASRDALKL